MRVVPVASPSFGSNTYLIVSGTHALVVDPAVSVAAISSAAAAEGVTPEGILLTHGHFDHMLSMDELCEELKLPSMIHRDDAVMLTDGKANAFCDFFGKERTFRPADRLLSDGELLPLGDEAIRVIHTPGHSRGSCCFLCGNRLITGDTVFAEGFGRFDLYGGDKETLKHSLSLLGTMDPHLRIYPGHGPRAFLGDALATCAYFL
jgi:glyoxylase-like metal-dependent hydrolase (beta-lactamase superfamily II)